MVIDVQNLVKRYGDLLALDHFNLQVAEGEIFGLLGPNGSGKTTAINCMLALLRSDKGEIRLFDQPMRPDAWEIKQQIGLVQQNVAVFEELNVRENIDFFCGLYVNDKARRKTLVDEAIQFVGLEDYVKFMPKKLSGGLLRRLNIACGIAHRPKLIFFDEPTVAVDPQSRNNILEGIQALNRDGATVLYTSHYMEEVEQICTRIAIMDKGRIIASGTSEELKGMIDTGETVTLELLAPDDAIESQIRDLPQIISVERRGNHLVIKSARRHHALIQILELLHARQTPYDGVYCQLPTLNDVFLEITGKALRD